METSYNPQYMIDTIHIAAHILKWGGEPITTRKPNGGYEYTRLCPSRPWHRREQDRYPMHPAVTKAINLARPDDWQRLLLEWPHVPTTVTDKGRVAYTQSEAKAERDLQTVTALGKYLRSHFTLLPDHAIRDIVASVTATGMKFVHTTAEMIYHLHRGPGSCMVWGESRADDHPYRTYDPKYGWHMCVHIENDDTVGRALCYQSGDEKFYVRTYRKTSGYSSSDEQMEQWLAEQGYTKRDDWHGCYLARLPGVNGCDFLAPYIDGGAQKVDTAHLNGERCLVITDDGEYECCNTDGTYDDADMNTCEQCSDRVHSDDGYWVGRHEDTMVCEYCRDEYYRYAYGRNGNQYYVHCDDVTYVESQDEFYHDSYLGDNGIITLENGEYEHEDNAVQIDSEWYHVDDDDIVRLDNGDYVLRNDAYECANSGKWYSKDDEPPVEVDGEYYHPDNAPEQDEIF
jgi:hypothetical protein